MNIPELLKIESLDQEGRGVARRDAKVIFVQGALPGETVSVTTLRSKPSYEVARTQQVFKASPLRVKPQCPHYGVCGGCSMQHIDAAAQVAFKQRVLEDALHHIGGVKAAQILTPIHGPYWGYRHRARLSVKLVNKKGGILVGFHEKKSGYVADIKQCEVLPRHVSDLLIPTRRLIETLSHPNRIPQIEVAVGDTQTAFVLRHMDPLTEQDERLLKAFGHLHGITWWLQPAGPDSVHLLEKPATSDLTTGAQRALNQPTVHASERVPDHAVTHTSTQFSTLKQFDRTELAYALPAYGLRMPFKPTDFTQVNPHINQVLIARALSLLEPQPSDRILDLFCGLGNFSLPLARHAAFVMGVEGSLSLTRQAQHNAQLQGIHHTEFVVGNLFEGLPAAVTEAPAFDRWLIDPPRDGALAVVEALAAMPLNQRPKRIVYVSCNPATLARDAAVLVLQAQYKLEAAGVINMFPHTAHVESMAVFNLV
jgi:23S rRNA (uracil1939-C5)-methyltransferase